MASWKTEAMVERERVTHDERRQARGGNCSLPVRACSSHNEWLQMHVSIRGETPVPDQTTRTTGRGLHRSRCVIRRPPLGTDGAATPGEVSPAPLTGGSWTRCSTQKPPDWINLP